MGIETADVYEEVPAAKERIEALEKSGFEASNEKLVGGDKTRYGDYFVRGFTE